MICITPTLDVLLPSRSKRHVGHRQGRSRGPVPHQLIGDQQNEQGTSARGVWAGNRSRRQRRQAGSSDENDGDDDTMATLVVLDEVSIGFILDGLSDYRTLEGQLGNYSQITVLADPVIFPFEENEVLLFRTYSPHNDRTFDIKVRTYQTTDVQKQRIDYNKF